MERGTPLDAGGGQVVIERLAGLCCIGCGKVEVPRPCIGICQDRVCELVSAADYDDAAAQVVATRREADALKALVRRFAWATPRDGEWERSYRALQAEVRRAVDSLADDKPL